MKDDDDRIEALKAIAHPVRLRILRALVGGERNVGDIDEIAQVGQPTLSQQLAVLRNAGLVRTRRHAKLVFYRIDDRAMSSVSELLDGLAHPAAGSALPRPRASGAANFARLT